MSQGFVKVDGKDVLVCDRGHFMTKIGPNAWKCEHCKTPVRKDTWGDRIEESEE